MTSKDKLKNFVLKNSNKYTIEEMSKLTGFHQSTLYTITKKEGKSFKNKRDEAWEKLAKQLKLK